MPYTYPPRPYDLPYSGKVGGVTIAKSVHETVDVTTVAGNNYVDGDTLQINGKVYEVDTAAAPGVGGGNIAVVIDVITPDTAEVVRDKFINAINTNDPNGVEAVALPAPAVGFHVYWKKAAVDIPPAMGLSGGALTHVAGARGDAVLPARRGEPYAIIPPYPYPGGGRAVVG